MTQRPPPPRHTLRKAETPALSPADDLRDALRRLLAEGVDHLLLNEPAARRGDAEAIHQMRVALRRLRAVLRLFRKLLDPAPVAALEDELRRLGRVLGDARDWDVFCTETLPTIAAAGLGVLPARGALARAANRERKRAHAGLRAVLRGGAVRELAERLRRWHATPALFATDPGRPIGSVAIRQVAGLEKRVRRRARDLARQDDEGRHRLRKALKTLRYGRDMLQALDEQTSAEGWLHPPSARRATTRLQEALGSLNDAVAARALAQRLCEGDAGPAGSALHRQGAVVERWSEQHRADALAALPAGWEQFRQQALRKRGPSP
ncbi:CHAD domain-containing protein [Rhizosaccharibacter radicis]|uniref:CHAD domain-containing protein n=1 Tax=Rhizosaccharibacter radicis TaxID=2782605 RepID=A0ABT1W202_9PROT|nr:CHAD domain-containing protein [Acetobacteraceae bacterium KSS12]